MTAQLSRRTFLQGLSGAAALAGLAACVQPAGPQGDGMDADRQTIEIYVGGTFPGPKWPAVKVWTTCMKPAIWRTNGKRSIRSTPWSSWRVPEVKALSSG